MLSTILIPSCCHSESKVLFSHRFSPKFLAYFLGILFWCLCSIRSRRVLSWITRHFTQQSRWLTSTSPRNRWVVPVRYSFINNKWVCLTEFILIMMLTSVADPDPPDPRVFGPPGSGSGSTSQRYGSGSGSFYHHAKIVRKTLIPTVLRLFLNFYLWKMM